MQLYKIIKLFCIDNATKWDYYQVIEVAKTQRLEVFEVPVNGYPRLKAFLVENNIRQDEIADILKMSRTKLNTVLNGKRNADFQMSEIILLAQHFKWNKDDIDRIFFNLIVA